MAQLLPVGMSDFAQLRRESYQYVDKSGLIVELVRSSARVVLLPRPRRFGKTLNLSMLRYWFERPFGTPNGSSDIAGLFSGLEVTTAGDDVVGRFQRHPVIYLTFKDVKHEDWQTCLEHVASVLRDEVVRLRPIWSLATLAVEERQVLDALAANTASTADVHDALRVLSRAVALGANEQVVLLVDEYDTPIHSGWANGYYDEVIGLFRNLLSGGLKDNPHIFRGVLTGILRVAKESLFSGLNNVSVHTLLSGPFSKWFGFSEAEVQALCTRAGPNTDLAGIRDWYNGYLMGGHVAYNPWSVLCYLAVPGDGLRPYWVNTASDEILRSLLIRRGLGLHEELSTLVKGGEILQPLSDDIQLRDLGSNSTDVWSFLLYSGYLKARDVQLVGDRTMARLSIPNREVRICYHSMFRRWIESGLGGGSSEPDRLCAALLAGDEVEFVGRLQRLVVQSLSYFDVAGRTPEAVYQAFLVGLLVQLDSTHVVDSNREAGFGRYDVSVRPRTGAGPAAVLELKSIDADRGETAESALAAAMKQIHDRQYASGLSESGADPVWLWAAVFDGKRVRARVERG